MRPRTARRLALAGNGEQPPEDHDITVLRRVWAYRESLRHLMAGDMLRGVRKVRLVSADGKNTDDESRKIELAAVHEASEALRLELVRSLIDELPEPPKPDGT